jgi:hypothetical protein
LKPANPDAGSVEDFDMRFSTYRPNALVHTRDMAGPPLSCLNNSVREVGLLGGAILAADPVVRRGPVDSGVFWCLT